MEMELRSQQVIPFCDSVAWIGIIYRESAVLTDTLLSTVYGCDSIVTTILTKGIPFRHYETDSLFIGETLSWHGLTINEAGEYYDEHTNHFGCDSTYVLRVVLKASAPQPKVSSTRMTICEGDAFPWRGESHTLSGTYYDTVFNGSEIDTLHVLYLTVNPRYEYSETVSFSTFPTLYRGQSIPAPGTYPITYTSSGGCDSVINVIVNRQVIIHEESATICKGEVYEWRFKRLTEAQDYIETIKGKDGKDSVTYILHLSVHEIPETRITRTICHGDSYVFGTQILTEAGEYRHTFKQDGCDSTVVLSLNIADVDTIVQVHRLNPGESYTWPANGHTYSTAGTYQVTNTNRFGCDSITRLVLTINHVDTIDSVATICPGETLVWHSKYLSEAGVYYDSLLTTQGYDSVYRLTLTVHSTYFQEENIELCPNRTTYLHGIEISKPGIYLDTLYTIHGCDSVYRITVNETRTFRQEYSDTICQGESYTFFGVKYNRSGTYRYEIGCDSIIILHLKVNKTDTLETMKVIADEDLPYYYNGRYYRAGGTYMESEQNRYGCDSTNILNLIVTQHASQWYQMPLCPGSEIKIGGEVITRSGLYTFLRRSEVTGLMDSLYRVEVYDAPAYDLPVETRNICMGDTIEFAGKKHWRSGNYTYTLKTTEGCDSIVHMDLTFYPTYQFYTDAIIADYQTYEWRGREYDVTGNYDITYPTINDCDSTYTLRLKVVETAIYNTYDTICEGGTYRWRGVDYSQDGIYTDTVYKPQSSSSAIYTLYLTVLHPTNITSATVQDICADARTFDITFTYTGAQPTAYSIYFDQLAKDEGFKDVINQQLYGETRIASAPLPEKPEVVYLEHTKYVKPNTYTMSLVLDNGICGKSSVDSIALKIKYPNWIIEQNWNDIVVPLKQELNGGYEFSQVDWYVNEVRQINNGKGYLQYNFRDGDQVVMSATRKGENYAIETCPLTIHINSNIAYDEPVLVYPTQTPRYMPKVTVESPRDGQYEIFNSTGLIINSGELHEGQTDLMLPGTCGIYFIRVLQGDQVSSHKVLVY